MFLSWLMLGCEHHHSVKNDTVKNDSLKIVSDSCVFVSDSLSKDSLTR
jgi:hypothetical protein